MRSEGFGKEGVENGKDNEERKEEIRKGIKE